MAFLFSLAFEWSLIQPNETIKKHVAFTWIKTNGVLIAVVVAWCLIFSATSYVKENFTPTPKRLYRP